MDDFAHIVGEDVHFRGRSPSGERGLKSQEATAQNRLLRSLPIRGAWIEIRPSRRAGTGCPASLPTRGAWIEIAVATVG